MPSTSCVYETDADLRIISVDAGWSEFAAANHAPELIPPCGPVGQSVLSCIVDSTSRLLYDQLFQRVLESGRTVVFPFRCDSPALRRFLEFRIELRVPSGLRIETTLLRTEARLPVALLEQRPPRGGDLLRMCGWCKSVHAEGRWCEVEDALEAMRLFERDLLPDVTHGICPSCRERMQELLDARCSPTAAAADERCGCQMTVESTARG
jgi:hypothetical protein